MSVLVNLALVFAVGIPIGLATRDKGYAALIGLVTFIVFINAMNVTLQLQGELAPAEQMKAAGQSMVLGVQVLEMGVFAGILTGALSGYLYNKYSGVQFNGAMAIYSGHCFVAIVMLPVSMLLGVVMSELWPYAQHGISALALAIKGSGPFGVAIYGFLERILVPTGLHHLVYTPFLYTELGGTQEVCGATYQGARNIYFAEMACPDVKQLSSTVVWDARGISKMFGLPAAALAMYMTAKPERKAIAKAILIPAALTSLLVGVTEPIEFSFLFPAAVRGACGADRHRHDAVLAVWRSRHRRQRDYRFHPLQPAARHGEVQLAHVHRGRADHVRPLFRGIPLPDPALQHENAGA